MGARNEAGKPFCFYNILYFIKNVSIQKVLTTIATKNTPLASTTMKDMKESLCLKSSSRDQRCFGCFIVYPGRHENDDQQNRNVLGQTA